MAVGAGEPVAPVVLGIGQQQGLEQWRCFLFLQELKMQSPFSRYTMWI